MEASHRASIPDDTTLMRYEDTVIDEGEVINSMRLQRFGKFSVLFEDMSADDSVNPSLEVQTVLQSKPSPTSGYLLGRTP